jgi:glycosyltransferase involved in cell wall biosynthesis
VLSLASQLRSRGYNSVIAAAETTAAPVRGTEIIALGINPPLTARASVRPLLGFVMRFPFVAARLLRFLRQNDIRIVNAHYPDLNVYYFLILQKLGLYGGKVLLSFHGADVQELHQTRGLHRAAWRYLVSHVNGNTTCSEWLGRELLTIAPSASVTAIHNGSDIELFRVLERPARHRRTLLQVAKFEPKKGQAVLLRATQKLRQLIPDVSLILVGADGPDLEATRQLIVDLGLESCAEVHVNVHHEDVPAFMRRADVFVLPSLSEPFGIALLEAGASRLPVVASRVGGIPELLEDRVTGLLVEPGNVDELEQAIRLLLLDDETADSLAKQWQDGSTVRFTWEYTCIQYLRVSGLPTIAVSS